GYEATNWWGIIAPVGTPKEIVDKVHAALTAAQDSPETQRRLESEGATVVRMSPQEFGAFMVSEMSKWEKVVRESGIKADGGSRGERRAESRPDPMPVSAFCGKCSNR